jgi:hypothetical protein
MSSAFEFHEPWRFPWPKPADVYSNNGPPEALEFELNGAKLKITPTAERGFDTGRTRYRCECLTCEEVLHEATSGASYRFRDHLKDRHGLQRSR